MGTKLGARHAWAMVWLVSGMAAIGQEALAAKPARGSASGPARDVQWTELGDVVVDSDAAWAEGQYRATSLTVANGATLTVAGGATIEVAGVLSIGGNSTVRFEGKNTDAQVDGVWAGSGVTLAAGDVVIEAGSRLAADGSGYGPSSGPGHGGSAGGNGGGGSYGGWGGQMGDPGGAPYGSIEEPVDLGSGGGWGDGDGTPGGGAIRLTVAGTLQVDGVISADGARVDGYRHGAGSGGSVWITTTGSLTGSGRISANGGATDWGSGTGGGGRVAICFGSSREAFAGTISAAGGQPGAEGTLGGAGTVYLRAADWPHGDLILDNAGQDAARLTPLLLNHTVRDLRLAHAAEAELTTAGDALAQAATGELRIESGTCLFAHSALTLGRVHVLAGGLLGGVAGSPNLTLTTAGDLVVEADGKITADGLGYGPSSGPGYGGTAGGNGGGGSYGGWGGQMGDAGGGPYGSIEEPVDLGSGGGWGDGDGTPGGGVIRLTVAGALKVDGVISADGARVDGYRHGAGSGGSVWITVTGSLTGSGRISANGGATTWGSGAGGGGRVAIYAGSSLDTFGGTISAASGQLAREGTVGGAGTVYLKVADWPHGDLILDNAGQDAARLTPLLLNHTVRNLRLAHAAEAELTATGDALVQAGTGELRIESGTCLFAHSALTLGRVHVLAGGLLGGVAGSPNLTLTTAGDMVVDVDGKITVDGLGYGSGSGPGYGGSAGANGGGGSYGGWGGQMGDAGGAPYGSIEEPVAPGSGGGWGDGDGTPGGGVLRLVVGGALRVDGVVSADGARVGGPRPGAGSGGSVWITVTGSLTGTGRVSANGGAADWGSGTGGGGRVAIYFGSSLDTFAGTISAAGGQLAREGTVGGAGTVYLKAADWPHGDLILGNAGQDAERLTPLVLSQTVRDLRLAHRAEAELTATGDAAILTGAGELSVSPGCRLLVHGGVVFGRAHVFGGATVTHRAGERGFLLKTNGDFVLDSGGLITADALGYGAGTGPGYGGTSGGYHGGGGSYGGWGGQMGDRGGVLYGSAEEPEDSGSGGGWGEGPGAAGGGAIRLIVARALQMDGTITANGETTGNRRGAGSGGSVWITVTGGLTGSGTVTANGGSSGWGAGAGGGGRVCVEAGRMSGTWSAHADGGNGGSESPGGSGGSVVIRYAERLEVAAQNFSAAAGAGSAPPESVPGVSQTAQQVGLRWVRPKHWLLHGVANLAWIALGENEVGASVTDVSAYCNGFRTPIASNLPLYAGVVSWDTTEVVDGLYEVRIITANLNGTASEGRQVFVVNNSAHWHGGSLDADQTWTADAVHVVESDVTIPAGVTLTVQPGAVVKFAPGVSLTVATGGTLSAPATADGHVVFTALSDDSAGGDTNLDGASSWPFAGWWPGLIGAGGTISLSDYAEVRYAVPVVVDRALPGNTTWSPWTLYRIRGSITVPGGVTLTILPGTVVKFEANASLEIAAGGSLVAQGTLPQPIVFTSIKDDAVGGDTDADAGQNPPFAGDWQWLHTSGGTITLDHATICYGGSNDTCGMVHVDSGGAATVRNSQLRESLYEGAMLDNGSLELTNCVLLDADRMVQTNNGTLRLVNCTIDRAITLGALAHGGALEIVNCIMVNCPTAINECCGSPASVISHSDIWNCGAADYSGANGNLRVDPKFRDAARGDYRLDYLSPCIDAADTPAAPVTDAMGAPRYDDWRTPSTGIPDAEARYADLGAFEFVESAAAAVDLVVRSVSGPLNAMAGDEVTVTWAVVNIGSGPAVGPWHDRISLVQGGDAMVSLECATVRVGGGVVLGPGQSVALNATVRVPGGVVGAYSWQVAVNSQSDVFEGQNRANNTASSATPVGLDVTDLPLNNTAVPGHFASAGQPFWYRFQPNAFRDVHVTLSLGSQPGLAEVYVLRGALPTRQSFEARNLDWVDGTASVALATTAGEAYYVLVYPVQVPPTGADFTIQAREQGFSLDSVTPAAVTNLGPVTLRFLGGQFLPGVNYSLYSPAATALNPTALQPVSTAETFVTFDLTGTMEGDYDAEVEFMGVRHRLAGAVHVAPVGRPGKVETRLILPAALRPGRPGTALLEYANTGDTDVLAPFIELSATHGLLRTTADWSGRYGDGLTIRNPARTWRVSEQEAEAATVLGTSRSGPAGMLRPGQRETVRFQVVAAADASEVLLQAAPVDAKAAESRGIGFWRPAFVTDDSAWHAVVQNLNLQCGTTLASFQQAQAAVANYLASIGEETKSANRIYAFQLLEAGLPRLLNQYYLGAFGRGRSAAWEHQLSVNADGVVTLSQQGVPYTRFRPNLDRTYAAVEGEQGSLRQASDGYDYIQGGRSVLHFRSDGRLESLQSAPGNRIVFQWDGDRVTAIAYPYNDVTTVEYEGHGRIRRITDPVGRTVDYTYDAAGEHLVKVNSDDGEVRYSYITGQGPQREHLVDSNTNQAGTVVRYDYDEQGRLTRTYAADGLSEFRLDYPSIGLTAIQYPTGQKMTCMRDWAGHATNLRDEQGHTLGLGFDPAGDLVSLTGPNGTSFPYTYNETGGVTSTAGAIGYDVYRHYNEQTGALDYIDDGRKGQTRYGWDGDGNLTSIVYGTSDGLAMSYGPGSQLTETFNGRGYRTTYAYTDKGLLKERIEYELDEKTPARTVTRDYDDHRNITRIVDAGHETTLEYDGADRLKRVNYPGGRWLAYTYDRAGRRETMTDQDGFTVRYRYTALGDLEEVRLVKADGDQLLVRYTYDNLDRLLRKDLGNGTWTEFTRDGMDRCTRIVHYGPDGAERLRFEYVYDAVGRRQSMGVSREGGSAETWTYTYDPLQSQLVEVEAPGGHKTIFEYDLCGNRVKVTEDDIETPYITNDLDQYTKAGGSHLGYDHDGNLLDRLRGGYTYYRHDTEGRLVGVSEVGHEWSFEYDALGSRSAIIHNAARTEYLNDPTMMGHVVAEYRWDGTRHYVHGLDLTAQVTATGEVLYYAYDGMANTVQVTGPDGAPVASYHYRPFGLDGSTGDVHNPFRYGGAYGVMDDGGGLYYMRQRYYDPELGRFIERDPSVFPGLDNLYTYAHNDPVNKIVPMGTSGEVTGLPGIRDRRLTFPERGPYCLAALFSLFLQALLGTKVGIGVAFYHAFLTHEGPDGEPTGYTLHHADGTPFNAQEMNEWSHAAAGPLSLGREGYEAWRQNLWERTHRPTLQSTRVAWADLLNESPGHDEPDWNSSEQLPVPSPRSTGAPLASRANTACSFIFPELPLPPPPNPPPPDPVPVIISHDPNDVIGPAGYGASRWVAAGQWLPYTFTFENKSTATAPAQTVQVVTDLSPAVDWATFELGRITFGEAVIDVPSGLRTFAVVLLPPGQPNPVSVSAELNAGTGRVTWTFVTLDPTTGQPTEDPFAGFLPPNDETHRGEGTLEYRVRARTDGVTSATIASAARIVFDVNAPMDTPTWLNTIDAGAPTSTATALLPVTPGPNFTVRWSGEDDAGGAGIAVCSVYASADGGAFALWQDGVTATEAVYPGEAGHTYAFYCVARDGVGNTETQDPDHLAETTTLVPFPLPTIRDLILGRTTKAPEQLVFADVNQDGRVDVADLVRWEVLASGRAGTGARFATGPQLSLVPLEVMPGFPATLEVRLDGSDQSYAGVNAQLLLPPGVAATAANPGPLLAGPGATADFEPFGLPDMEHGLTIVAYSTHQAPAGPRGDGVLVTLDLAVAADLAQGTYPVSFASPRREVTVNPYAALASTDGRTSILPATVAGTITVLPPDSDNDGLPDLFEKKIIDADPNDAITGIADVRPGDDFDGDGSTNLLESQQSTDPTAFQWAWHMTVTGAYAPYLELGLAAGALPGWDALDQDTLPVPPEGNGSVYSTQDSLALKRDVRPPAPEVDWLIVAAAGSADVALTWSPAGVMPPGKYLSLYEVDAQRRPVATGSLDLGVSSTLQVAAGETRLFRIHYGADLVVPLRLQPGWNLISLPVAPRDPRPAALFRSASEGRSEDRGALFAGDVWGWRGGRYQAATEIEPLRGYWVYCQAEATVLVHGTRLTTARFVLDPGWNLLGPQIDRAVPGGIASPFECCVWDPAAGRYVATAYLQVGRGHWLVSPSAGTIDLGPVGP